MAMKLPPFALTALALILATPVLAETKAVISGGPAATCAQAGAAADANLPLCSQTDKGRLGDDDDSDDGESESDDKGDDEGDDD